LRPLERRRAPPLGLPSLIATSAGGVHSDPPGVPIPSSGSVLDVSHVHDGLLRHADLRLAASVSSIILGLAAPNDLRPCGLVSSRCHVQGSPYRGLSLPTEPHRVSPAVAFVPFGPATCGLTRASRLVRRLQGLAPRRECGAEMRQLAPARSAPLMGFSSSGCSLLAACEPFRVRSVHGLDRDDPTATGPRRFATARIGWPGCRLPTRSRFPTCCPFLLSKNRAEVFVPGDRTSFCCFNALIDN
jgi:hypothetical protein